MSRWEERGRGWESRDIMLGTLDTSQTSPRTCWSGGLDNSTVPWDNPESSQLPSVSLQQNSPRQGKKYKITLSDRKKKNTLLLQRTGKEKESVGSADRSRSDGSLQSLTQGSWRHSQDSLSQGNCSARGPGAALLGATHSLGMFIFYETLEGTSYLVLEESISSTSFAKCFLCFWIFGISTCNNTGRRRR